MNTGSNPLQHVKSNIDRRSGEIEAVVAELERLKLEGKLDEAATRRLEGQIRELGERHERELESDLAEIRASHETPQVARAVLPPRYRPWVLLISAFIVIGSILELAGGGNFIFSRSNEYRAAMPWLFAALLPAYGVLWSRVMRNDPVAQRRYSTAWVRWLVMLPLTVLLLAGMTILSPLGWAALGGWIAGVSTRDVPARVVSIQQTRQPSKSCDQKALLDLGTSSAEVCIEGRVVGDTVQAGDSVLVAGRDSLFGLYVDVVRRK